MPEQSEMSDEAHAAVAQECMAVRDCAGVVDISGAAKFEISGNPHAAESLRMATVHWLRHTGISEDVKSGPREHVRDDAGHSSSAITDRYIDIELHERARSAKKKPMISKAGNRGV